MANSYTSSYGEFWAKMMQALLLKTAVYPKIARRKEEAQLSMGYKVHFPYGNKAAVRTVAATGAVARADSTITDDYITVDQWKAIPRFIDNRTLKQSNFDLKKELAAIDARQMANYIDAQVLYEVINAGNVVDDGSIGGSSGNPITLDTGNVWKVITAVGEKLNAANADSMNRFGVLSPNFINVLDQYRGGKESGLGDRVMENGFIKNLYGMDMYMSNNSLFECRINFGSTNASDGDTFTLNGVTFTMETSTLDAAGKIDVGSDVAGTCDNIVAALNDPFTDQSGVLKAVTDSEANRLALEGLYAVDGASYVTVYFKGGSDIAVSETFASANITISKQVQHLVFGVKGKISLAIQKEPNGYEKERSGDSYVWLGKDIVVETLYGTKLFTELAKEIVDVQINVA
jgi:hypothetical protein